MTGAYQNMSMIENREMSNFFGKKKMIKVLVFVNFENLFKSKACFNIILFAYFCMDNKNYIPRNIVAGGG